MHREIILSRSSIRLFLCAASVGLVVACAGAGGPAKDETKPQKQVAKADAKKAAAKKAPGAGDKCFQCHQAKGITGSALRDWVASKHATEDVGCADCHLTDDSTPEAIKKGPARCVDKKVRLKVSSRTCGECHGEQAKQFASGKHSKAWIALKAMPTTKDQPHALIDGEKGCGGCHRIGRDEGKCDSCHTRHLFTAAEARRPEACATCHMGFDHPQWEMYSTSKHGAIYRMQGGNWDWSKKLSELYGPKADPKVAARAPVCATCHMPKGDHGVRTAWGFLALRLPEEDKEWMGYRAKILQGLGVLDDKGKPTGRLGVVQAGDVARLTAESWKKERARMTEVCVSCHATSYAEGELAKGDAIIKASDKLMAEAITIIQGLYKDGILDKPKDYPMSVDLLRFYEVENPIEQVLYEMFLKHRMRSFQGAFHMNPDYQHWYGWAQMKKDIADIRHKAKELRAAKSGKKKRRRK